MNKTRGFSLIEVLVVLVIIGVLAGIITPQIISRINKARQAEAMANLGAVRFQELLLEQLTGKFTGAADQIEIEKNLQLLIQGKYFDYQIMDVSETNFLAEAIPKDEYANWLEPMAIDKNGFVSSPYTGSSKRKSATAKGGGGGGGSKGSGGGGGSSGGGRIGGTVTSSGGGNSRTYVSSGGDITTSYYVVPPTNLILTENDGWIVFSCANYADTGFLIQSAQRQIDGTLGSWGYIDPFFIEYYLFGDSSWEDEVVNGTEYCYRAASVVNVDGTLLASEYSEMVCGTAGPDAAFTTAISDGRTDLNSVGAFADPPEGAASGTIINQFLTDESTPLLFGDIQTNALAYRNSWTNTIVMDLPYLDQPPELIAALLGHEGLHAIWDKDYEDYVSTGVNPSYGLPPADWTRPPGWTAPRSTNSLYQEYSCFLAGVQVWNELKTAVDYNSLDATGQALYDEMEFINTWMFDGLGDVVPFSDPSIATTLIAYGYGDLFEY